MELKFSDTGHGKWLVAWTEIRNSEPLDCWEAFEEINEAYGRYRQLKESKTTFVASVTRTIESTDYEGIRT